MTEESLNREIQRQHLDELCRFINQSNEQIEQAGYTETIASQVDNYMFDSDLPEGTARFDALLATYRQRANAGYKYEVFEITINEERGQNEQLFWRRFAESVGMPLEELTRKSYLYNDVQLYFDRNPANRIIFLRGVHYLSGQLQAELRTVIDAPSFNRDALARYFALGSGQILHSLDWQGSPFWNVFVKEEEGRSGMFKREVSNEVIAAFRRAINDLRTADSATVALPSGRGKTTFVDYLLRRHLSSDVIYISMQGIVDETGQAVDEEKLRHLPSNREAGIVFIDEAQLLADRQKDELRSRFGKVTFLETTDFRSIK
ncbi:MAG TPA: AAA family ATPase [Candidatus Bathyarchaeia archaeon]|nr:AAA family ATPase [Candidatus Bathyarchaeia archaeon]